MEGKQIRVRCWIEIDGEKFFGPGPVQLLELIEKLGSIAKAAKTMGMSYKKAWDIVNDLNTRGRSAYVISKKGGENGGGAELTESGKSVIASYRRLVSKLNAVTEEERGLLDLI